MNSRILAASYFAPRSCHAESAARRWGRAPDALPVESSTAPTAPRGHRRQHVTAQNTGDGDQLVRGRSRDDQIANRERDLDPGRQQARALYRIARFLERAIDRCERRVGITLGEAEERQAWLRLTSSTRRVTKRGLRLVKLATVAKDLAAPIRGLGRYTWVPGAYGALSGML